MLIVAGYAVATVTNAKAGLTDAVFGCFDLAFVDLLMPEINGVEMIRAMKLINMDMKIIIFTAFREKFHKDLKGIEVDAILEKPCRLDKMLRAIQAVLAEEENCLLRLTGLQE